MTRKQLKEALLRGRGRCIQAVHADPEKYYSVVLWACGHEIAFDAQCEGSRAWFVYQCMLKIRKTSQAEKYGGTPAAHIDFQRMVWYPIQEHFGGGCYHETY